MICEAPDVEPAPAGSANEPAGALVVAGVVFLQAQSSKPSFRVGVDVISLNVLATDGVNRHIADLEEADFAVFEDGVRQELQYFSKTPTPIAFALLLDTSASMEDKLATAQDAAAGFVQKLGPRDVAAIIDFDSTVRVACDFTGDRAELERAIRQLH
jgi:VWFA-related protein